MTETSVDFGKQRVSPREKTALVKDVFETVANRYDVMNDIMSMGSHRVLKRIVLESTGLRTGQHALDIAGGTGDVARLLRSAVGHTGSVVLLDINEAMLLEGRNRLFDQGITDIHFVKSDSEALPFDDQQFHAITVCFGLRNMTNKAFALQEMRRVLKSEGSLQILDFAKPPSQLIATVFDLYRSTWPVIGRMVVGEGYPYRYLNESIDNHLSQKTLALMLEDHGFRDVTYDNLLGGTTALHRGIR